MRRALAQSGWRDASGAIAIEMAFALPIFLLFLMGSIGFGHVFWIYNSMQFAADQAGRYAMLHPTATHTEITNIVTSHLYGISAAPLTVTITEDTAPAVDTQTIVLLYNYDFLGGLVSFLPSSLTTQVTVPLIP